MLNVQTYNGVLNSLGVGTQNRWGVWTYSMLEIGDTELRNVQASDLMSSYLRLGLGKDVIMRPGKGGGFTGKRLLAMKYDGKLKEDRIGAYVGAVILCAIFALILWAGGVWQLALITIEGFDTFGKDDDFSVERKMKVRIIYNPNAAVPLPRDVFNDPDDEHLN